MGEDAPVFEGPGGESGAESQEVSGARFRRVHLRDPDVRELIVQDARVNEVYLARVRIRGAELHDIEISGEVDGVVVNGVDIGPLVEAELLRRFPERAALRPHDAAGYRAAWDTVEQMWAPTVERARRLVAERGEDVVHEQLDGEWSFVQTLRHLCFATRSWIARAVLGDPAPWHPLDLPWDGMTPDPSVPWDREARPSLEEVLALRAEAMGIVREVVDSLTDERLAGLTEPVEGPGWPPAHAFPVHEPLDVVLNEEWWHHRYAVRDLDVIAPDVLEGREDGGTTEPRDGGIRRVEPDERSEEDVET